MQIRPQSFWLLWSQTDTQTDTYTYTQTNAGENIFPRFRGDKNSAVRNKNHSLHDTNSVCQYYQ